MGAKLISPTLLAEALGLVAAGSTPKEAAALMQAAGKRIGWRVIYKAKTDGRAEALGPPPEAPPAQTLVPYRPASRPTPTPPQPPGSGSRAAGASGSGSSSDLPPDAGAELDADGTPLEVMRGLLASATKAVKTLDPASPRMNQARTEARALAKAIDALESRLAAQETPEDAERRRRAEDGETRKEMTQYVEQAEAEAEARGVCVTCGVAKPPVFAP
jgi:hypothetical protein